MKTIGARLFILCVAASGFRAQQPSDRPALQFEVASVKLGATNELGGVYNYPGGRVGLRGCTLQYLIQQAFDIQEFQIAGGPAWMDSVRFDIDAKPPESSVLSKSRPPYTKYPLHAEQREMLQSLLIERFQLKYRRETREGPVYLLLKGNRPLKMEDSKDKNEYPWSGGLRGGMLMGDGIKGINESMPDLAQRLSPYLEKPVLDRTELTGSYDFQVDYRSDEPRPDIIGMILTCVQQLGLKLETGKGPVETLVIERAEKPVPN
ncbi:MAG TPA: TIGR03435 family protein [Bryobacteraceae bacterium]|nr:TIGR03435 family protein [Bryobacteraceae bacterium]